MECKWEMNIFYLFSLGSKIKKAELNQRIMLACFLMVLGQLSLREIAPKPKTEPNTSLGGNYLDTFPYNCSLFFLTIVATI